VLRFLQTEARALVALGRVADATRPIDRSLSLAATAGPPQTPGTVMENTVRELSVHGYRDESLTLAARAVEWYRRRPADAATGGAHRAGLARVLYLAERWEEAAALFSALAADNPGNVEYVGYLGCIAARTNASGRAQGISAELERVRGHNSSVLATHARARIAALLGDRQRAVDLLRDALTQGLPYGVALHNDPDFEPLRDYEPFVALIRPSD
jgi:tetratricopeptide (TPR) repeat protein